MQEPFILIGRHHCGAVWDASPMFADCGSGGREKAWLIAAADPPPLLLPLPHPACPLQNTDNQAGIVALGGLQPLLDLLETCQSNLQVGGVLWGGWASGWAGVEHCPVGLLPAGTAQVPHAGLHPPHPPHPHPCFSTHPSTPYPAQHNAAFALYGLSDNEDNLLEFVKEGAVQRIHECELVVQASKDCVNKLMKRLQVRGRTGAGGGCQELHWWGRKAGLSGSVRSNRKQRRRARRVLHLQVVVRLPCRHPPTPATHPTCRTSWARAFWARSCM